MKLSSKHVVFIASLLIFALLTVIIVVSGNRAKDPKQEFADQPAYVPETIIFDDEISGPFSDNMPDGVSYNKISKRITTDLKTGSRLVMTYPVFSGYGDSDASINELVEHHNQEMKRIYGNGMEKMLGWNIKVIYEVNDFEITYADRDLISILFSGVFSSFSENDHIDTGNYYFKYSLNIDVKNVSILSSDQLISDYLSLKSHLVAGDLDIEYAMDGLFKFYTYYDMLLQYGDAYNNYPMLYFTKDKVNVIISLTPDLGGHALFSYNIQNSRDFIDSSLHPLSGLYPES